MHFVDFPTVHKSGGGRHQPQGSFKSAIPRHHLESNKWESLASGLQVYKVAIMATIPNGTAPYLGLILTHCTVDRIVALMHLWDGLMRSLDNHCSSLILDPSQQARLLGI